MRGAKPKQRGAERCRDGESGPRRDHPRSEESASQPWRFLQRMLLRDHVTLEDNLPIWSQRRMDKQRAALNGLCSVS